MGSEHGDSGYVLITMMGKSPYAFLNGYAAVLAFHRYFPDHVFVVYDDLSAKGGMKEKMDDGMAFINREYDLEPTIEWIHVRSNSITECMEAYDRIVQAYGDGTIAVDITAGRKYMVSSLLIRAWPSCHHVFFLQSDTLDPVEKPLPLRARYNVTPIDLKHTSVNGGGGCGT